MIAKSGNLKERSRELRKDATKQENHLWYDFLSAYPLHFYRQRAIGGYIVDFYCPKAKMVIELDGSQHLEPDAIEYDNERTKYLNAYGLQMLRFPNSMIDAEFDYVCKAIDKAIKPLAI